MDKNTAKSQSSNMQEAATAAPVSSWGKFAWQSTLLATLVGIFMCFNAIQIARSGIEDGEVRITSIGILTLIADVDLDSKTITGNIIPTRRGDTMKLNKPEVPWLKAAIIALILAILANLYLLYLIAFRRESAMKKSKGIAIVVAISGVLFFTGSEIDSGASDLAIGIIAYSAVIHFACNGWPLLRAQLYKA